MIAFLILEFNLNKELTELLQSVSPATIDRKLKFNPKGIHTTKPGSLLKSQIPLRVCFDRNEKRPGFFELDTVSHCGANASGQFCQTLTVTDSPPSMGQRTNRPYTRKPAVPYAWYRLGL
jgi:hypothetical protein